MRLTLIFTLLFCTFLSANIYDEYKLSQDTNKPQNYFFSNDFDEIIRFNSIVFEDDTLSTVNLESLKSITQKINSYKDEKRNFYISIIGHTMGTTDNKNENTIDSSVYANKIQNNFRYSYDTNQSQKSSKHYAKKVKKYLIDDGVDQNIIKLEYRGGLDPGFSDETEEGNQNSNRVMVSLYIEENLDLDNDGVLNATDMCPNTHEGMIVDIRGCKVSSIIMLVENNKKRNAIEITTTNSSTVIGTPRDYLLLESKYSQPKLYKSMPDEKMKVIFGDVLAGSDLTKFVLYFDSRDFINKDEKFLEIIDFLADKKDSYIQIIGHTDTKGTNDYNNELAKKRAETVAQKIKNNTSKYLHLQVESYGEYNLVVKTPDGVSEAQNRRVEVLIR